MMLEWLPRRNESLPVTTCVGRAVLFIPSCLVPQPFSEPIHELTPIQAITDGNSNSLEWSKHCHRGPALISRLDHRGDRRCSHPRFTEEGIPGSSTRARGLGPRGACGRPQDAHRSSGLGLLLTTNPAEADSLLKGR